MAQLSYNSHLTTVSEHFAATSNTRAYVIQTDLPQLATEATRRSFKSRWGTEDLEGTGTGLVPSRTALDKDGLVPSRAAVNKDVDVVLCDDVW